MPAECALLVADETCLVAAVGRCHKCSKPFCSTHQARDYQRTYVDFCVSCQAAKEADNQRYLREKHHREAWLLDEAPKWLAARGVPSHPYGQFRWVNEPKAHWWSSDKSGSRFVVAGRAWLLGEHSWHYSSESYSYAVNETKPPDHSYGVRCVLDSEVAGRPARIAVA